MDLPEDVGTKPDHEQVRLLVYWAIDRREADMGRFRKTTGLALWAYDQS
jgi:hypothetical protein